MQLEGAEISVVSKVVEPLLDDSLSSEAAVGGSAVATPTSCIRRRHMLRRIILNLSFLVQLWLFFSLVGCIASFEVDRSCRRSFLLGQWRRRRLLTSCFLPLAAHCLVVKTKGVIGVVAARTVMKRGLFSFASSGCSD
jgi:hypothetical protein